MLRSIACFFGLLKVVRFNVDSCNLIKIKRLLRTKTLYTIKYRYPHLTQRIDHVYDITDSWGRTQTYVDMRGGPFLLDFFNEVFYYEWNK